MNMKSQIIAAWCGILCPFVMFGGLVVAGFFPPMSPNMAAAEVAAFYQQHTNEIRFGMAMMQISAALYAFFISGISAQMRRMENREVPVLSYTQLACGAGVVVFVIAPSIIWICASFRPERSIEATQTLNDLAWLMFVGVWATASVANFVIGFLILSDKNPQPVFPRWLGFLNIWIALSFFPIACMPFFKIGPFAWNGLLTFWVPAVFFGAWFFSMSICMIKAAQKSMNRTYS